MVRTRIATRLAITAIVAAGFATTFAGGAGAEQLGPRLVGSGNDVSIEYPVQSTNVVGGAHARLVGSGEATAIEVIGAVNAVQARIGQLVGSGEAQAVIYADPMPALRGTPDASRG